MDAMDLLDKAKQLLLSFAEVEPAAIEVNDVLKIMLREQQQWKEVPLWPPLNNGWLQLHEPFGGKIQFVLCEFTCVHGLR